MQLKRGDYQRGMSLIELLVSMVIGTLILGGMMTIYLASRQSYNDGDQLSMMDESARTALDALKRHLEHAGYTSTTGSALINYVLPPTAMIEGENISTAAKIKTSQDGTTDTVGVRFKADNRLYTDCLETALKEDQRLCAGLVESERCAKSSLSPTASLIYNSFGINTNTERNSVEATIPMLVCYGSLSGTGQVVAQGVENMQINYGVDTNFDKVADRYINATQAQAEGLWDKIISIQIALLIRSRDPFYSSPQQQTYQLLDRSFTAGNDQYKRAVYQTLIRLRNAEG